MPQVKAGISPKLPTLTRAVENFFDRAADYSGNQLVYESKVMDQVVQVLKRVAPKEIMVLISGESGTGKELISQLIHKYSPRRDKPFLTVNCGALSETLLESELFGCEVGEPSQAYLPRIGLMELANGGTLFFDNIGEVPLGTQAKLLRFLKGGKVYRVGGREPIPTDVRILAATDGDLTEDIYKKRFRQDLYYRLSAMEIHLPPLRTRREDIPGLIQYYLNNNRMYKLLNSENQISEEALELLKEYDWPGNVRELQNVCEQLLTLTGGHTIMPGDLPEKMRPSCQVAMDTYNPHFTLHELEKNYILKVLKSLWRK